MRQGGGKSLPRRCCSFGRGGVGVSCQITYIFRDQRFIFDEEHVTDSDLISLPDCANVQTSLQDQCFRQIKLARSS